MSSRFLRSWAAPGALVLACACSKSSSSPAPPGGAVVVFDSAADLHAPAHFFDFPWPSDTRLTSTGAPDLAGLPNPEQSADIEGLRTIAMDRAGFPVVPVAWFQFTAPLAPHDPTQTIAADKGSPLLLIDVDATSSHRGALVPTVAQNLDTDDWLPPNVLAIGPLPGFILSAKHQYAFVVMRSVNDATGAPLGVAGAFASIVANPTASDPVTQSLAPLWPALTAAGVDASQVAAATVFTTGDVVADLATLSSNVLSTYASSVAITNAAVDSKVLDTNDRFCEVQAEVNYPQFQPGAPPYDTGGIFVIGSDGAPVKQGEMTVPVTLTLPKQPMPAGGYPLVVFFHGTGGYSEAIADRGPWRPENDLSACPIWGFEPWNGVNGCSTPGQGPGWVLAPRGFAMAASALPVNPQRWPGGANQSLPEYVTINNIAAMRDIFRQGVIEQRLFFNALSRLTIPPSSLTQCTGLSLPSSETSYHFNTTPLLVQGQSMGAMYANLISAVEPNVRATVATGAGGYWSYFILITQTIPNIKGDLRLLLDTPPDYTHLHPSMHLFQIAIEPVDPIASMPRIAHDPLPGAPVRPIYEPHGLGDSYFPTQVQNAVALAYRNQEAGDEIWPTMPALLTLGGIGGFQPYPVSNERTSLDGTPYTGVVIEYQGDGIYDPHAIYSQLDAVKYQYGCFFETMLKTGKATVPEPSLFSTPCPGE